LLFKYLIYDNGPGNTKVVNCTLVIDIFGLITCTDIEYC